MGLRLCLLVLGCLVSCQGLELTLTRGNSGTTRSRSICGVLICEEITNVSVSSTLDKDLIFSEAILKSIKSISVFKKGAVSSDSSNTRKLLLLGSLTSQTPSLTRVANGRKLDGSLQPGRASLRIELVKQADCESEFSCQVRGKDSQGREVVSTTSLVQQPILQRADQVYRGSLTSAMSLQVLASIQQLAQSMNGLENRLENKIESLENRIEDKLFILQNSIGQLQRGLTPDIVSLENRLQSRLDLLENRIENEIHNPQLNTSLHLDKQIPTEIRKAFKDTRDDIVGSLDIIQQRLSDAQSETLKNISERFEKTLSNATVQLTSILENFESLKNCDQTARNETTGSLGKHTPGEVSVQYKTIPRHTLTKGDTEDIVHSLNSIHQSLSDAQRQTLRNMSDRFEKTLNNVTDLMMTSMVKKFDSHNSCNQSSAFAAITETQDLLVKLTSGEVAVKCVSDETSNKQKLSQKVQPLACERDMGKTLNQSFPQYITMTLFGLDHDILCDTRTDGGGWTVILRRAKGDVYFQRDWESYKNGFGKSQPGEDFWLGNDIVHVLTYIRPYELRVELTSEGKEYVQIYKTFKLESEANKYTLRLGSGTGPIDTGSRGLSYSNNARFSTFDNDGDVWGGGSCALTHKSGWWYKHCHYSKLTTPWVSGRAYQAWYTGSKWLHPSKIEMKIRPLKST